MKPLLELKDLSFGYPGRPLFEGLNFSLQEGARIGLIGPNGAGKSTLLRLMLGLERPHGGKIYFRGQEVKKESDFYPVRREIGLLFQDPEDQLFCPTVEEDLAFGPLNLGLSRQEVARRVVEVLQMLGLEGFEKRLTYRLSGGEKRLVALGAVLTMEPRFLLLDEPTGDLDWKNFQKLVSLLQHKIPSYLVISHDFEFLELVCEEILWLEEGRLEPFRRDRRQSLYAGVRRFL